MRVAILLLSVTLCGCAMQITPPADVQEPVRVFIADYGVHASLLLPRPDGRVTEFAYGQYDWFALNRDRWYHTLPLLLVPSQGALGRRILNGPATAASLNAQMTIEGLFELAVERSAAASQLAKLKAEYEECREASGEHFNPQVSLTFVKHPRLYWCTHTCNVQLAEWLEALGCRVGLSRAFAEFEIGGE